jgi:subtilase family serine protease
MIRRFSIAVLAIFALLSVMNVVCLAEQPTLTHHLHDAVVSGRTPAVGHLPASQSMRLVLSLPLRDQAGLEEFLRDVNNASSPNFHHFLTVDQFTEKFGPTQDDYDTVARFAKNNGLRVVKTSRNRLNLDVTGSVATIEKALHVKMNVYQHDTENRTFFSPDREPSLDLPIQLWHVTGLDNYSTPRRNVTVRKETAAPSGVISNATVGSCPSASFCGSDMRAAYYGGTTLTGTGQSVGLLEYIGTDLTDLTTYYTNAKQTNNVPVTLDSVDTQNPLCKEPSCDDTEQTLDMTQALGMAPGMSSLVMYIGTGGLAGQSLDDAGILNAMATASPLNLQLSSSWAWQPADPNTDNPYFLEFQAQGQNFFVASGDDGNWGTAEFVWPADSVYAVAVGGTDLDTASAGGPWKSETAWIDGGGGISPDKYAIPSWQVSAAAGCTSCSQKYRNGPDVSANANFTFYVCADQRACTANEYGGTSFAAPMWAGYLALANQQAATNGTGPIGFINPTIYSIYGGTSYDTDFHDITSGTNGTFSATVGYDLATGLGSPNGANLINALAPAGAAADFTIAAAPKQVKITQGTTGKSKITTTISGSFDSAIALSATGQKTGVTVVFQPSSIAAPGAGTATMGIKVSATAPTGLETITVTGTGGGKTHTATVMIDVVK